MSYADTYAIIFNDNFFTVSAQPREIYEAINHKCALTGMLDAVKAGDSLSEKLITEIDSKRIFTMFYRTGS